ncbi:WD40 repeat-like protein, partial [Meira miltonrushii]
VFTPDPIKEFKGHTSDILDLSWSKGGFLLSASMDKTARVWHLSWPNNLVAFVHGDFVTSAVFHPRDDRFFLSGSLDGKLRLWNISTKKVQASQEVPGLITACAFTHSGNTACVGTFSGAALFYQTDGLVFSSSVAVRSASGKHQKGGRKITAI